MLTRIALAVAEQSPGESLVPAYYLTGIIAAIVVGAGGLVAVWKWYDRQRRKWTTEGKQQQRHTEAMEANTKAAQENTEAIGVLATKLDGFAAETRTQLRDHDARLRDHGQRLDRLDGGPGRPTNTRGGEPS